MRIDNSSIVFFCIKYIYMTDDNLYFMLDVTVVGNYNKEKYTCTRDKNIFINIKKIVHC